MKKLNELLVEEEFAYAFGLLLADGSISRCKGKKGRVTLEINERDSDIIYYMANVLKDYRPKINRRTKTTNFKENNKLIRLALSNTQLVNEIEECGLPSGKKSKTCGLPTCNYNVKGLFRGFVDGDGSLGITSQGVPFISVVTASEDMKEAFLDLSQNLFGYRKKTSRNKRDDVYNIIWTREEAVELANFLYQGSEGKCIKRKYAKYVEIMAWVRTKPKASPRIVWTPEMDDIITSHRECEAMKLLGLSQHIVQYRRKKLKLAIKS